MTDRYRQVPASRLGRLAIFGQLAGGVATGMVGEGLRRIAQGERPQLRDLLLTPANAAKVTGQLSKLRGAAMKLGQMLSMDAGDLLPPELTAILAQLRETAHFMPTGQLEKTLVAAWGSNWRRHFTRFNMTPIAAASIGQVHRAVLADGREVAIKVQYPGIAASIDADIDNVATLLKLSSLLPDGIDFAPHLAEAKRQLAEEADYLREAEQMRLYRGLLADDPRFVVPEAIPHLLHPTVLPMDYVTGAPIEMLAHASDERRNDAMNALMDLTLRELFEFGLMQTDPNFANYRWQRETGRIVLLDFGAARHVSTESATEYRALLRAGLNADVPAVRHALVAMDFLSDEQMVRYGAELTTMIELILGRVHDTADGQFDFADRAIVSVMREKAAPIIADRTGWRLPSPDKMFIQRKIAGMALLASNMKARLPLVTLLDRYC